MFFLKIEINFACILLYFDLLQNNMCKHFICNNCKISDARIIFMHTTNAYLLNDQVLATTNAYLLNGQSISVNIGPCILQQVMATTNLYVLCETWNDFDALYKNSKIRHFKRGTRDYFICKLSSTPVSTLTNGKVIDDLDQEAIGQAKLIL